MSLSRAPTEFAMQLREIMAPEWVRGSAQGVLRLHDQDSDMTFDVTGVSNDAVAVRVDRIQHLKALASKENLRLVCDYLLVDRPAGDAGPVAVLLELKKTIGYDPRAREQLRRSLPILRYLQSACEVHFMQQVALQEKYVLVGTRYHPGFDKQPIRFDRGRHRTESHRGIEIKIMTGVGERFATLIG